MTNLTTARATAMLGSDIAANTAIARFIANDEAQSRISELVAELFSVALESGQAPRDWDDISCDGSLKSVLADIGFEDDYSDDADFQSVLDDHLDDLADEAYCTNRDEVSDAVKNARSLAALRDALEDADDFAKRYNLDIANFYDPADLPTFGGAEIEGPGIFSYDETDVLWGFGEWTISPRDEETGATVIQDSCSLEIDGVEYRSHDRYYFGKDQIDTVRFSRWEPQDPTSSVFSGYLDIDAFDRDRVLLSELIERIKEAEAELEASEESEDFYG